MTARILVLQLDDREPPARLGEWLVDAGADVHVAHPAREKFTGNLADYAGVVCLGAMVDANDVIGHPWLADVRALLSSCVSAAKPVLAICLGAQQLAIALGGTVETGANGPEIGPGLIAKRDVAWTDPLFAELPLMPDVVQFHRDVVARLPVTADLLASSTKYPNQAFRIGRCAYGIQFHLETTPEIVLDWASTDPAIEESVRPGDLDLERLAELHADVEEVWRPFVARFVRLARGDLAPFEPARPQLPMI